MRGSFGPPQGYPTKSPGFAANVGGDILTNHKIKKYMREGRYGLAAQKSALAKKATSDTILSERKKKQILRELLT